jgi:hypothetical protein
MLGRRRLVRSAYQQLANVRLCHPFHLFCRFKFRPPVRRGPPRGGRRPIEAIVTLDCAPNVPIVDPEYRPIGVLNARDVLEALLEEAEHEEMLLRDYVMSIGHPRI